MERTRITGSSNLKELMKNKAYIKSMDILYFPSELAKYISPFLWIRHRISLTTSSFSFLNYWSCIPLNQSNKRLHGNKETYPFDMHNPCSNQDFHVWWSWPDVNQETNAKYCFISTTEMKESHNKWNVVLIFQKFSTH